MTDASGKVYRNIALLEDEGGGTLPDVRENLPYLLSATDLITLGFSRPMAYQLLNRADLPTVRLGGRRLYMHRDNFLHWLDQQSKGGESHAG